jgi:hypothetical protein
MTPKYTLPQILNAWQAAYGECMSEQYPGFLQRLFEENASQASDPGKGTDKKHLGARTK